MKDLKEEIYSRLTKDWELRSTATAFFKQLEDG
jgi:hypothetical protein